MVWFYCDQCGDSIKKPKLEGHERSCRSGSYTCIDCCATFAFAQAKEHMTCVTEEEKYAKGATKPGGYAHQGYPGGHLGGQQLAGLPGTGQEPEGLEFLSKRHPFKCSLCNVTTTSYETLLGHAKGGKHQRKVRGARKASEAQADPSGTPQQASDHPGARPGLNQKGGTGAGDTTEGRQAAAGAGVDATTREVLEGGDTEQQAVASSIAECKIPYSDAGLASEEADNGQKKSKKRIPQGQQDVLGNAKDSRNGRQRRIKKGASQVPAQGKDASDGNGAFDPAANGNCIPSQQINTNRCSAAFDANGMRKVADGCNTSSEEWIRLLLTSQQEVALQDLVAKLLKQEGVAKPVRRAVKRKLALLIDSSLVQLKKGKLKLRG